MLFRPHNFAYTFSNDSIEFSGLTIPWHRHWAVELELDEENGQRSVDHSQWYQKGRDLIYFCNSLVCRKNEVERVESFSPSQEATAWTQLYIPMLKLSLKKHNLPLLWHKKFYIISKRVSWKIFILHSLMELSSLAPFFPPSVVVFSRENQDESSAWRIFSVIRYSRLKLDLEIHWPVKYVLFLCNLLLSTFCSFTHLIAYSVFEKEFPSILSPSSPQKQHSRDSQHNRFFPRLALFAFQQSHSSRKCSKWENDNFPPQTQNLLHRDGPEFSPYLINLSVLAALCDSVDRMESAHTRKMWNEEKSRIGKQKTTCMKMYILSALVTHRSLTVDDISQTVSDAVEFLLLCARPMNHSRGGEVELSRIGS